MSIRFDVREHVQNGMFHFNEDVLVSCQTKPDLVKQAFSEAAEPQRSKAILRPRIMAITAGTTRNHNRYLAEKLKGDITMKPPSGVHSFVYPYPKPMIKNHDHDSEATGRIRNAQFVQDSVTGKEAIIIIPEITDPDAIEKILDGRYLTVSIGAQTDSVRCSICGTDLMTEGMCDHYKGEVYDGVVCEWILGNLWFDECSWVNVPADVNAGVFDPGTLMTMESYVKVGESIYDLSGVSGHATITESAAKNLGVADGEGGNNDMSLTKEQIEALQADLEQAKADKEAAEAAKAALEAEKAALEATVAELQAAKTELEESKTGLEAEKTSITQEKDELTEKVQALTSENETLKAEKESAEAEIVAAKAKSREELTDMVASLELACNDGTDTKEALVERLSGRTTESLKDKMSDLFVALGKQAKKPVAPGKVTNPGHVANPGEDAGQEADDTKFIEESFKTILKGSRNKR